MEKFGHLLPKEEGDFLKNIVFYCFFVCLVFFFLLRTLMIEKICVFYSDYFKLYS